MVLSFDDVNALNSDKRSRILPTLAKCIPSVAGYTSNLSARTPQKLRFRMENGLIQVVHSRTGVEQG